MVLFLKWQQGKKKKKKEKKGIKGSLDRYVDLQPVGMGAFGLVWYVYNKAIRTCMLITND